MQEENIMTPEKSQVKKSFITFDFNTLLMLVLLAGLVVLYILWFTGSDGREQPDPVAQKSGNRASMVYVNLDTLNASYEFVKALRSNLEATGNRLQKEVLGEQAALEKEAAQFQQQIQSNAITEERARVVYEQLMQKQQALMEKKELFTQQIAEKEISMNMQLVDTVISFLKRYNMRYGYDFIMGYKAGGDLLVGNDTLDITRNVLDALNKEYQERK